MKAEQLTYFKEDFKDGTILEAIVWKVEISKDHPHGLKYRLHFGKLDGTCIYRYDNEKNKGDHRHIGNKEQPYHFLSLEKLLKDFRKDVQRYRGKAK